MSLVIHKFPLLRAVNPIQVPYGAHFLHAGLDNLGQVCVWVSLNADDRRKITREVYTYGTGRALHISPNRYLSTFPVKGKMLHVYVEHDSTPPEKLRL